MKTLKIIGIAIILFLATTLQSQVSINVNIGSPPRWIPAGNPEVQYYYLPDIESYYDVKSSRFIYVVGGSWVYRKYLPTLYRDYDLYGGYKVVMKNYHGKKPYSHFKEHKMKYAKGYKGSPQKNIGERPGNRNNKSDIHSNGNSNNNKMHRDDNHGNQQNKGGKHHKNK